MGQAIRIISQLYDATTGEIKSEKVLHNEQLKTPKSIQTLGYKHKTQIEIIQKAQDFKLLSQEKLFNTDDRCPMCGKKTMKRGKFTSSFHSVFTDHQLEIQRRMCTCGWRSHYTVEGLFGCSMHPELLERQSLLGAEHSFQKAETILTHESCQHRPINNDDRIKRTVSLVGEKLELIKKDSTWSTNKNPKKELIVTVDGGHLQSKTIYSHSFEAMIATVYESNAIKVVDKHHKKITDKVSVASALDDNQSTIKQLLFNACRRQGMNKKTMITALTDGASNCWDVIGSISNECGDMIKILDWFHIGKKFRTMQHVISKEHLELFDKVKWHLWHGHPKTSLLRLEQLKLFMTGNETALQKLESLKTYIENNQNHIVDYHGRRLKKQPYTSNVAESSVNALINSRQKRNQKMQWTRVGAHAILQVRTSIFSKDWQKDWKQVQKKIYKEAA